MPAAAGAPPARPPGPSALAPRTPRPPPARQPGPAPRPSRPAPAAAPGPALRRLRLAAAGSPWHLLSSSWEAEAAAAAMLRRGGREGPEGEGTDGRHWGLAALGAAEAGSRLW